MESLKDKCNIAVELFL